MNTTAQKRTPSASLTGRQLRAIAVILTAPNMEAAAHRARVGRTTLYQWLREPAFRDELNRQQNEVFDAAFLGKKPLRGRSLECGEPTAQIVSHPPARGQCIREAIGALSSRKSISRFEQKLGARRETNWKSFSFRHAGLAASFES